MPQPDNSPFDMPDSFNTDNLYPRDGASYDDSDQYFDQPEERTVDEQEQANEVASTIPFLKEIHAWFDDNIADLDKTSNIQIGDITVPMGDKVITVTQPVSIEAQLYGYQIARQILTDKKATFPDLEATV